MSGREGGFPGLAMRKNGTSAGRARACVLRRETPTRAPPASQAPRCLGRNGGRGGDDRGSGSHGTLGISARQHRET